METLSFFTIELAEIVIQLTLHCIVRSNLCDRVLDSLNPTFRISLLVTSIIQWQDFCFKDTIDSCSIQLILIFLILISTFFSQSPTSTFTIAFKPPSIKNREVYYTIHQSLFTRSTRCFQWTSRSIHPNINTRNKATCQLHIIIFEEDNLTQEFRTLRNFYNFLDQSLSCAIVRVSFSCKQELYWIVRIIDNLRQTIQISKQQMCTFISCETTSKTDQQCIRINLIHQ